MAQDDEGLTRRQAWGRRGGCSGQRKGFAKAQRHDSHEHSGSYIELSMTGARKACGEGVEGRKTGARGILNKAMIRSDFHLMKMPQEPEWKPN